MKITVSRRRFALGAALMAAGFAQPVRAAMGVLAAAIANNRRSPKNTARDRYRHPAQVLSFFRMRNNFTVLEIEPGGGYWTEILAPYLKAHGVYEAAVPPAARAKFVAKLQEDPASYGAVKLSVLDDGTKLAPDGSVDLVLSFRNLHDWMADGTASQKLALIRAALKPGGVFGIEDHRGLEMQPQDPLAKSGYVREDYAIALITKAGFKLTGVSQIGDNPRDTKNYSKGVWTLPPTLALGDVDRSKYLAIGESDRWTLKFRKV
jgi:predicted methyltransferase